MKLPGSEQGFSSHPIVTQMVSSISSLKPKPSYLLLAWPPAAFMQRACGAAAVQCSGVREGKGEHRSGAGSAADTLPTKAVICIQNLTQFQPLLASQEKHCGVFRKHLHNSRYQVSCRPRQMCRQSGVATCVARMSEGYWHFVSFIPRGPFSLFKCNQNGGEKR